MLSWQPRYLKRCPEWNDQSMVFSKALGLNKQLHTLDVILARSIMDKRASAMFLPVCAFVRRWKPIRAAEREILLLVSRDIQWDVTARYGTKVALDQISAVKLTRPHDSCFHKLVQFVALDQGIDLQRAYHAIPWRHVPIQWWLVHVWSCDAGRVQGWVGGASRYHETRGNLPREVTGFERMSEDWTQIGKHSPGHLRQWNERGIEQMRHKCIPVTFCPDDYDTIRKWTVLWSRWLIHMYDYIFMLTSCWLKPNTDSSSIRVLTNS